MLTMKKKDKNGGTSGRPTDYNDEVLDKVDEYLQKIATKENGMLPTVEGFALYIRVERKTLYNWANAKIEVSKDKLEDAHPEFKKAMDRIMAVQLVRLINDGIYMGKAVNPVIIKMMLVNNHGMKDEISNKLSGEITNKFNDKQIARIAERITSRRGDAGTTPSKE
jgi:hypothetical protein